MGSQMIFWCDRCGKTVNGPKELEEFVHRRGKDEDAVIDNVCADCATALQNLVSEEMKYRKTAK